LIRPFYFKLRERILDKPWWIGTFGISSNFFTNHEGADLTNLSRKDTIKENAMKSWGGGAKVGKTIH